MYAVPIYICCDKTYHLQLYMTYTVADNICNDFCQRSVCMQWPKLFVTSDNICCSGKFLVRHFLITYHICRWSKGAF